MVDYRGLMEGDIILKDNQPSYVDIYNLFDLANGYNKENTKNWKYMHIDDEWLKRNFEYEDTNGYFYYATTTFIITINKKHIDYDYETGKYIDTYVVYFVRGEDEEAEPDEIIECFYVNELQHYIKHIDENFKFKL